MARARASGLTLIQHVEAQLQRGVSGEAAVNGPVEGQVNRLKTIKREMYGRAGVELLLPDSFRSQLTTSCTGLSQNHESEPEPRG